GYTIPIPDLLISDANGENFTSQIIENPYYNFIVVAWDMNQTNMEALGQINALLLNAAENYNIRSILLTANSAQEAERISDELRLLAEVFYADAVPLKSMVRANPGVLLMQNGVVIDKWHYNALPSFENLEETYFSN